MVNKKYRLNKDPSFWQREEMEDCNCGSFALNIATWFAPYGIDDYLTLDNRNAIFEEMMDEGCSRQDIMDAVLEFDQQAILKACPWVEPVLLSEALPTDRLIAYRLSLDSDLFECGEIDDDYHFRVRINGFWFEKCGGGKIRFCGTFDDESPWYSTPYLMYDSDVKYFRFKK